jgi:hypothetical protein
MAAVLLAALLVPSVSAQFIYVGNTGEDTVSKIDINTNTEVARYSTWFTSSSPFNHVPHRSHPNTQGGPCPSRIVQDPAGNVYVLNRFFNPSHLPVLMKIAPTGGTPGVDTSNGPTNVLPINDVNNNNTIDSGEAKDVRILWAKEIGTAGPISGGGDEAAWGRALGIDATGVLWVGMFNTKRYYRVDSATGNMLPPLTGISVAPQMPYGCQVAIDGKLWSVDNGSSLAEIDTATKTLLGIHSHGGTNYSLSIFNGCGSDPIKVYVSNRPANTYLTYAPPATTFSTPVPKFDSLAVGVDHKGNILSGEWHTTGRVMKTSPTGAVLWDQTPPASSGNQINDLHGLIVDNNDDVWAVDLEKDRLIKYSGVDGHFIAAVPVGIMPYTYGNPPAPTCSDTTTGTGPSCAPVTDKDIHCDLNGGYSYTFTVTNSAGGDMSQILLTPLPGSTFTLSQELFNLPTPLHNGQSTTLSVSIGNVKPGEKICFFLSLMSDKAACCIVQVCPKLPKCGDTYYPPPPRPSPTVKKRR